MVGLVVYKPLGRNFNEDSSVRQRFKDVRFILSWHK